MNKCKFKIYNQVVYFYKERFGLSNWGRNLVIEFFELYRLSSYVIPTGNRRVAKAYETFHRRMKLESTKRYMNE